MSFFPALAGAFVVPVVGGLATRLATAVVNPAEPSGVAKLGVACHAGVGLISWAASGQAGMSPEWASFAQGGAWGEVASAGFLVWAAYVLKRQEDEQNVPVAAAAAASAPPSAFSLQPGQPSEKLLSWLSGGALKATAPVGGVPAMASSL